MRRFINVLVSETSECNIINEVYQEEKGDTFTDDGKDYDLNKVLKMVDKFPIIMLFVKDLEWVLKSEKIDAKSSRVQDSDLNSPILVGYYKNRIVVLDGIHRLQKAVNNKNETMIGKFVPESVMLVALVK